MKGKISYTPEKRLKELFSLMARDEIEIRETVEGTFILAIPHPNLIDQYILSVWRNPNQPKEFVDLGRATKAALALGATSVRFVLSDNTLKTF